MSLPDNDRIADPLDRAAAETESAIAAALTFRKPSGPLPIGECHNCGEPLTGDQRWCDKACCDDWEKDQALAKLAQERD